MNNKNGIIKGLVVICLLSGIVNVAVMINVFKLKNEVSELQMRAAHLTSISDNRNIAGDVRRIWKKVVELDNAIQSEDEASAEDSEFINASELASILKVEESAIVDSMEQFPHLLIDGEIRFNKKTIIEYFSNNKINLETKNMTPKQAAEYLHMELNDVFKLINDPESGFPYSNVYGYYRINTEELKKWMDNK